MCNGYKNLQIYIEDFYELTTVTHLTGHNCEIYRTMHEDFGVCRDALGGYASRTDSACPFLFSPVEYPSRKGPSFSLPRFSFAATTSSRWYFNQLSSNNDVLSRFKIYSIHYISLCMVEYRSP